MKRASTFPSLVLTFALVGTMPASAQDASASPDTGAPVVAATPSQPASSQPAWLERELEDANERSRRIRNALIGTSAAFAVGIVFSGVAASQCQLIQYPIQDDELLCNTAGDVLFPLGLSFSILGGIGVLTSGIMLGVANKRKRDTQRDMRRHQYGRRLQLDPSGALVF